MPAGDGHAIRESCRRWGCCSRYLCLLEKERDERALLLLFGTEASAKGWEIQSRKILIDSPTSSVGLQLSVLLFNSNKQALMTGFEDFL